MTKNKPVVLCFSGHDPSGGAGIQADIEAIGAHQCHTCTIITALTEQDTANVHKLRPQSPEDIVQQAECLMNDIDIDVIKIGLLGNSDVASAVKYILSRHSHIPVILDPVLAAGGGKNLSSQTLIEAIDEILPYTYIITPNRMEARKLCRQPHSSSVACASNLMEKGCGYVLITGADEASERVNNQLFNNFVQIKEYHWPLLPNSYHGSGCTLAAVIAALLAKRYPVVKAVEQAQYYTWNTLRYGFKPGHGQHLPNRFFTFEHNDEIS